MSKRGLFLTMLMRLQWRTLWDPGVQVMLDSPDRREGSSKHSPGNENNNLVLINWRDLQNENKS